MKHHLVTLGVITALLFSAATHTLAHDHIIKHKAVIHEPKPVPTKWPTLKVVATAYVIRPDPKCRTYTNLTKSGTRAQRGVVAVDTRVIPFGTVLRIPGYGRGIARDTGGAITGLSIDLAVDSCAEAFKWGRRVIVLSYHKR